MVVFHLHKDLLVYPIDVSLDQVIIDYFILASNSVVVGRLHHDIENLIDELSGKTSLLIDDLRFSLLKH